MARRKTSAFYCNVKGDKDLRVVINRCGICDDRIMCQDDIESQIVRLDEINNSYLDEHDKHEPKLLLCDYCPKEYHIPGYPLT